MMSVFRRPMRSANAPVNGADHADANVSAPRNSPDASGPPPRSRTWNGAVGISWNSERKTVNVKPHIRKKRGVKIASPRAAAVGVLMRSPLLLATRAAGRRAR